MKIAREFFKGFLIGITLLILIILLLMVVGMLSKFLIPIIGPIGKVASVLVALSIVIGLGYAYTEWKEGK